MANRNTLHKKKLDAFKVYLKEKGIPIRDGKGQYQELQVNTPDHGWKCIYSRHNMPEHLTIDDYLFPLVLNFLKTQHQESTGVWTNGEWEIKWFDEDHVIILGPHCQKSIITGGDFESMLSCLCDAFRMGQAETE